MSNSRRVVLPLLATVLLGTIGFAAYALVETQEMDQEYAQAEIQLQTRTVARVAAIRSRHAGVLVLEPETQEDVRKTVLYCDRATRTDVAALRDAALHAPNPLVAGNAVRALGRLRAVARDAEVAALVRDPRPRVRDETILALGESGDPAVAAVLEPLVRHDDPKVRLLALRAFARLGGDRAEAVAKSVIDDPASSREELAFARAVTPDAARTTRAKH